MKDKLFTSTNSKKGILLEIEGDEVKISVWKKETPIPVTIDKKTAFEINSFLISELSRDEVDAGRAAWWKEYVEKFKEQSDKAERLDDSYDPKVLEK